MEGVIVVGSTWSFPVEPEGGFNNKIYKTGEQILSE
jgi:hypothetical protein